MKISKRLSALLLTLCMLLSLLPTSVLAVSTEDFSDFPPASHWAHEALEAAVQNGLMNGDGSRINPANNLSRAEMAAVINRAFGAAEKADISAFTDVAEGKWYYDDISKAVAMGTFQGDGSGVMRPEADITRQEAFLVLARAFELSGAGASALDRFTDKSDVADWASDALAAMAGAGYINGDGGRLNPLANITRQEFAQVMFNVLKTYVRSAGTVTGVSSGNVMVSSPGVTLKDLTVSGDLILGEGADNTVLDNVKVTGRIVVRCGSKNALALTNGSQAQGEVIVAADGVGISADKSSTFTRVSVNADNVAVSGSAGTVTAGEGVTGATVNGDALKAGESTEMKAGSTGGGGGGGTPSEPVVATTSLTITPPDAAMLVGHGYSALAVTRNDGANDDLTWESSNETAVRVDENGRLSAVSVGEAVISAESASGVVGSTTVYVVNPSDVDTNNYTITEPGTVLENCVFFNLTIAESVGAGEVTLKNVTVQNKLIVLGGGSHSVTLNGGSYGEVDVNSTLPEQPRILTGNGVVVGQVNVDEGSAGAIIETQTGSNASIGSVTSGAPLSIVNSDIPTINTSADLTVSGTNVGTITTSGTNPNVNLNNASVNTVTAGAQNTTITGNSSVPLVNANGSVNTGVPVGTVAANGNANVTASAPVSGVTGSAGSISLTNSGGTAVSATANSVNVSGDSRPTVSGDVGNINIAADNSGSAGVTVTGTTQTITTTGTGSVGEISVGGNANPTVNMGAPASVVSVSDSAGATVTGSSADDTPVVNTATGSANVSAGGQTVAPVTPVLQSIAVTSLPSKTEYAVGGTLDTAGLVVTGYYTVPGFDGTISKAVTATVGTIDSTTAGSKEVSVSLGGKSTSFKVTVVEKVVASIAIKTAPTTITYDLNNGTPTLNLAGGKLTVTYTSALYPAEELALDASGVTCTPTSLGTTVGGKTITVTYGGKTTSFTVRVLDSAADAFELAKADAKAKFLTHFTNLLLDNAYSETGKAAMRKTRDGGVAALEALTYRTDEIGAIATTLAAEKGKVDAIPTQDEEWTAEAETFKAAHTTILAKTVDTVVIGDKAAVTAALSAYSSLASGVTAKLTAQKTLLDSLKAKIATLEAAQTVEDAKTAALATLESADGKYASGYTANRSNITEAKNAGVTNINAAATTAEVTAALDSALAAMAAFKSDAVLLAEAKTAAINKINVYLPNGMAQADYNAAYNATGKAQVADERAKGVAAINAAADSAAVTAALNTAKGNVDAVKTAATMTAEALSAAKTAAKAELNGYGNAEVYREGQKTELTTARANGCTAIDACATTADVTTALKAARTAIDAIKTDAQLTAEELTEAKADAKDDLKNYKSQDDYSVAGWQLVQGKLSAWSLAIDACTLTADVTAATNTAKAEIDALTIASAEQTANADLVTAAKTTVVDATYTAVAQADASDAVAAKPAAETAVAELTLPVGVTATVLAGTFTAAVAGDADDPDGTNGSYTFTVKLEAGKTVEGYGDTYNTQTTSTLTLPITATAFTGTTYADAVAAAKTAVEHATYAAAAQDTEEKLAAYVKGIAETAAGAGITVAITKVSYTDPVAGTLADTDGTAGSYVFTATLTKGTNTATTSELTLTVAATKYIPDPSVSVTPTVDGVDYMGGTTLTAAAADILSPTYQWYKSETENGTGVAIEGATSDKLELTDLTDTAYYYCECGATKSNVATVTVAAQGASATPSVTVTGMEASYTLPLTEALTLAVTAADTYAYKWEKSSNGGESWDNAGTESSLVLNTPVIEMNGYKYRCTVTNTEPNKKPASATSEVVTLIVKKGTQSAPALTTNYTVTQPAEIDGKGTIAYVTGTMEYSADNTAWSDFTAAKTNLAAGAHYLRFKETADLTASPAATVTITAFEPTKEPTPAALFEATTMTLSNVAGGMKYSLDGGTTWADITGTTAELTDVRTENDVKVKQPGNGTTTIDSLIQTIDITKADAPTGLAGVNTSYGASDGKITGTSTAMEYAKKTETPVYADCAADEITDLAPGTYLVRVKAAGTALTSEPVEVKVEETGAMLLVDGVNYTDLSAALTAAGTGHDVHIAGDYTIAAEATVCVDQGQRLVVMDGGSLTNLGTLKFQRRPENEESSAGGRMFVLYGGAYTLGSTELVGENGLFKLLDKSSEGADDAGYVLISGALYTEGETDYLAPHIFLENRIEVPAGKAVSLTDYNAVIFEGDTQINGSLSVNSPWVDFIGRATVGSTGSLTVESSLGPNYAKGTEAGTIGGGVEVEAGGSYTANGDKLFGTGGTLSATEGSVAIAGAPDDAGENPFLLIWGEATVGKTVDLTDYHLLVDSGSKLTIPSDVTVTLASHELRGAITDPVLPKAQLINNGTLELRSSMEVSGDVTNTGTIDASFSSECSINLFGGATMNNSGTIRNLWHDDENSDDPDAGWWENSVLLDFSEEPRSAATLTNTGSIDFVTINCFVGDDAADDIIPTLNTAGHSVTIRMAAAVRTTAGLKRAIAAGNYDEYNPIGDFELTESVTIAGGKVLYAPAGWNNGTSVETCSFTVKNGATLTNNGELQFYGNATVGTESDGSGTIVNNSYISVNSYGDNGKHFLLNGTLTNNGNIELNGGNAEGTMAIHSPGRLDNNEYMNVWGYLITNSNEIINNGTVDMEYAYDESGSMTTGFTGYNATGEGEWNGHAYVGNEAGLRAAAYDAGEYLKIVDIFINPTNAEHTLTVSGTEELTIPAGVTLNIWRWVNDEDGSIDRCVLDIDSGAVLTIDGSAFISGELRNAGTLTIKGKMTIEAIKAAGQPMGLLNNSGTAMVGSTGSIDCKGSITTSGAFTNNGTITKYPSSSGYPQYGTVSGPIDGSVITPAIVGDLTELKSALENNEVSLIVLSEGAYALTDTVTIERDVTLKSVNDGDWDAAGNTTVTFADLTIAAGKTLATGFMNVTYGGTTTVNGTLDSGPGESVNTGSMSVTDGGKLDGGMGDFYNNKTITVESGGSILVQRGRKFVNCDTESGQAALTIEAGATMTIGDSDTYEGGTFENWYGAEVSNSGTINAYSGFNSYDENFTNPGILNNYQRANLADVARVLAETLGGRLDGLPEQLILDGTENDLALYDQQYSDWSDFEGDEYGEYAVALLLKNNIITREGKVGQYERITRGEVRELLERLAAALEKSVTVSAIVPGADSEFIRAGSLNETGNNVGYGEVTGSNELRNICNDFLGALDMESSVNVTSEEELTEALSLSYVTEIHITASMTISGAKDNEYDDHNSYYLTRHESDWWGDRFIYVDDGVTLTVGDGATGTKLDINEGVVLEVEEGGILNILSGSGINAFGMLLYTNDENITLQEGAYINYIQDTLEFAQRLYELVGSRLEAPTQNEIDGYTNQAWNWPDWDEQFMVGYAFLVKYGGETPSEGYWEPSEKINYGDAMSFLTAVYKAINGADAVLPEGVTLATSDWTPGNDHCLNQYDLDELMNRFADELPQLEDTTTTGYYVIRDNEQNIQNTRFTQHITVTCDSSELYGDDWGGVITFNNCEFAAGLTIVYNDAARYQVDFTDSCTVTGGVTVSAGGSTTLWTNRSIWISGAKGLAITASAPVDVSCGSGESFTLNGVTVTGTGNTTEDDWFSADIIYNCDGNHNEWGQEEREANDHSTCKLHDNTTPATTSPELLLQTGEFGEISASATSLDMNVRVDGNADISGLSVAEGREIAVSDLGCYASVNIGTHDVSIYDVGNGYFLTGTGTVTVRNSEAHITAGGKDLGVPHVFGSEGAYQIYVGIGSADNLTFKVEQGTWDDYSQSVTGWTEITPAVDETYAVTDNKLHLKQNGDTAAWITDPYQIRLTVTVSGGPTVVYEQL